MTNVKAYNKVFKKLLKEEQKKQKSIPIQKKFNVWDVEDPESAGMSPEENIEMWQYLEDSGMAYSLQGWYGRQAVTLISAGFIAPNKKYHSKEFMGQLKLERDLP